MHRIGKRGILGVLLVSVCAFGGHESGGGDAYAQEFMTLARQVADSLRTDLKRDLDFDPAAFSRKVDTVRVTTRDITVYEGAEVDAINYPRQNRIELNRHRWATNTLPQKTSLVIHEILGLMNINDGNYGVSGALAEKLRFLSNEALRKFIVQELNAICGDAWCEDRFTYHFYALQQRQDLGMGWTVSCSVGGQKELAKAPKILPTSGSTYEGRLFSGGIGTYLEYLGDCRMTNIRKLEEMVEFNHLKKLTISERFYNELTDCIVSLEKQIPRKK